MSWFLWDWMLPGIWGVSEKVRSVLEWNGMVGHLLWNRLLTWPEDHTLIDVPCSAATFLAFYLWPHFLSSSSPSLNSYHTASMVSLDHWINAVKSLCALSYFYSYKALYVVSRDICLTHSVTSFRSLRQCHLLGIPLIGAIPMSYIVSISLGFFILHEI